MTWREASARLDQHVLERLGRMRIVDQDGERLPLVHRFEATRDTLNVLDPATDRAVVDAEDTRRRDGAEDVLDVEAPRSRERIRSPGVISNSEPSADVHVARADLGVGGEPECDGGFAERPAPRRVAARERRRG